MSKKKDNLKTYKCPYCGSDDTHVIMFPCQKCSRCFRTFKTQT